jgi:hypothetical protein
MEDFTGDEKRLSQSSSIEESKTEADKPFGSDEDDDEIMNDAVPTNDDGGDNENRNYQHRRSSTRSIKPIHPFTPTSPEDPAVKASLAKSGIGVSSPSSAAALREEEDEEDRGTPPESLTAATSSPSSSKTKTGVFVKTMYDMVDKYHKVSPNLMRWSDDGRYFIINPEHKNFGEVIEEAFGRELLLLLFGVLYDSM